MRICRVFLHVGIVAAVHSFTVSFSLAQDESRNVVEDLAPKKSADHLSLHESNSQTIASDATPIPTFKELSSNLMTARDQSATASTNFARLEQRKIEGSVTDEEFADAKKKRDLAARQYQIRQAGYAATMLKIRQQLKSAQVDLEVARKFHAECNVRTKEGTVEAKSAIDAQQHLEKAEVVFARWETCQTLYKKIGERLNDLRETYDPPADFPSWGFQLVSSPPAERNELGKSKYRGGMRVIEVTPESPAEVNGIVKGDILVGIDKWETLTSDNVSWIIRQLDQGNVRIPVKVFVIRAGESKIVMLPFVPAARELPKAEERPHN